MTWRKKKVLYWLLDGSGTVDEFVRQHNVYVNSWAPTFTHLFQEKLIRATGDTRLTQYGASANIWQITDAGTRYLAEEM